MESTQSTDDYDHKSKVPALPPVGGPGPVGLDNSFPYPPVYPAPAYHQFQTTQQPPPFYPEPQPAAWSAMHPVYPVPGDQPMAYGQMMAPPPPYAPQFSQPLSQQQHVVMLACGQSSGVQIQSVQSFAGQIFLSCFVFWFCNPLFGLIAFVLAVIASSNAVRNPSGARQLGRASYHLSCWGIFFTVLVVAICIGVVSRRPSSTVYASNRNCNFYYNSICYNYQSRYYSAATCYNMNGYYYSYACYYN